MINNSKILTVSYGTFSCTLEGFDDSFTTMKAIAEYFRDLAADDRYFGAEPPTPDAEMLARIAERGIERRVQAHDDDGKIVLRAEQAATSALVATEEAPPADAGEAPKEDAAPQAEDDRTLTAAAPQGVAAKEDGATTATPDSPPAPPVARTQDFTAPMPERAPTATSAEVEMARKAEEDARTEDAKEAWEDIEIEDQPDTAEETPQPFADLGEDEDEAPFAEADPAPANMVQARTITHPDPDSVAAKLSRIRAVVADSGHTYGIADYTEDEHAQDYLDATAAELDAALAADDAVEPGSDMDAQDGADATETVQTGVETQVDAEAEIQGGDNAAGTDDSEADDNDDREDGVDDVSSLIASVSARTDARSATADEAGAAEQTPEPATPAEHAVAEDGADLADNAVTDDGEDTRIEDTLAQLMADAMPESTGAEGESDADDDDIGDDRPMSARVLKMKRADLESAMAAGQIEEDRDEGDTVNLFSDEPDDDDNALSPEEEAELQRDLAEVEADFIPDLPAEEGASEADDAHGDAQAEEDATRRDVTPDDEDGAEEAFADAAAGAPRGVDRLGAVEKAADVSRIFEEADHHREEPGSNQRRTVIQHLRAAVAATRADKSAGVEIARDKDDSAYRSDLANAVRPRRPRAGGTSRSERPGTDRPAPLKLVAEQRIDTPRDPIRPRRITASDVADIEAIDPGADVDGSFADFAEEMGVGSLPDLLEAAAAYMADVEGRPQFSRPMLMGKLKEVEGDAFSREDGLRSFGQLLRQGKLQKLKGGRFAVTDETDFRARARNVG